MEPTKWLKPLLPDGGRENVKYLILWTFPGQETLDANQDKGNPDEPIYYCNLSNRFWKVMEGVFWKGNSEIFNQLNQAIGSKDWESVYKLQREICTKYGIALRDRVAECYLSDSSKDAKRLPNKYHNFYKYIMEPNTGGKHIVVLLNWRKAWSDFRLCKREYKKQEKLFFMKWGEFINKKGSNTEVLDTEKLQSWMNFLDLWPISIKPLPSTSWRSSDNEIVKDWEKILEYYK